MRGELKRLVSGVRYGSAVLILIMLSIPVSSSAGTRSGCSIDRNQSLSLRSLHFGSDDQQLDKGSNLVLEEAVRFLHRCPTHKVKLAGHTDERSSWDYGLVLGDRRAALVKRLLVQRGIASSE